MIHCIRLDLIFELDSLASASIDPASTIASPLLLVLLLRETLALSNDKVLVSSIRVVVRHVLVRRETGIHLDGWIDATEGLIGLLRRGRAIGSVMLPLAVGNGRSGR
jgi:hypothetical protein